MKKVFLAGEGKTELGYWCDEAPYRPDNPTTDRLGLLELLLRKCVPAERFRVVDGALWKSIRKFKAGDHRGAETRNVLGLALKATELDCDVLVFSRDRDRQPTRARDIESGMAQVQAFSRPIAVVGGVAIEAIESWVLSLAGKARAETHADPKTVLRDECGCDSLHQQRAIVEEADFDAIPSDAQSLLKWLDLARKAL